MFCHTCNGWTDTTGSCQISLTIFSDFTHLDDCPIHFAHKSATKLLSHLTQVDVIVRDFSCVQMFTEVGVGRVGSTVFNCLCVSQVTIGALTCRCSREDTYLEWAACLMFCHCLFSQFLCYCFGNTCWRKPAQPDIVAILNHCCCFCRSHTCKCHNAILCFIYRLSVCKVT